MTKRSSPLMVVPRSAPASPVSPKEMQTVSLSPEQQRGASGGGGGAGICVSQALDAHLRSRTTGTDDLTTILQMRTLNLSGDPGRSADW